MGRSIKTGIAWAILGAFPLAALVALCYRFPIPFSGYESGPRAVPRSLIAVVLYGLFAGGFIVLAVLGAAAGTAAKLLVGPDARRERWLTVTFALAGDLVAVMILAVLDKLIGKW
jgi:hypothetical protein